MVRLPGVLSLRVPAAEVLPGAGKTPRSSAAAASPAGVGNALLKAHAGEAPCSGEGGQESQDPVTLLKAKLELSEAVKREMKSVIRAQHAKIEELREELVALRGSMSLKQRAKARAGARYVEETLSGQESSDQEELEGRSQAELLEELRREHAELQEKARRLRGQVTSLKSRNADLLRANRRCADMLSQTSLAGSCISPASSATPRTPAPWVLSSTSCTSPEDEPAAAAEGAPEAARPTARSLSLPSSPRPTRSPFGPAAAPACHSARGGREQPGGHGGGRFVARAVRDSLALWNYSSPRGLMHQLLYGAARLVNVGGSLVALMLYVVDPWLRAAMAAETGSDNEDGDGCRLMRLTVFYLSGKVTVHGYQRDGNRPVPPRFASLAALPVRDAGPVVALPLRAGPGQPVLAALQGTASEASGEGVRSSAPGAQAGGVSLALTDSQVAGLQLLCSTAAGILDMRRRVECVQASRGRALACIDLATRVHCAPHLSEFEQRAKILTASFFNVASARITFYDPASRELLLTATRARRREDGEGSAGAADEVGAAIGRRNITRIPIEEGIVGRCLRKQQVIHADPVLLSPYFREVADGVEAGGRNGRVNMLAGPMVAELSEDAWRVMGVLQLIEKQPPAEADPAAALEESMAAATGKDREERAARQSHCGAFSTEDRSFFEKLLRVLGLAAYRTMQVQTSVENGLGEINVARLLGATT